MQDAIINWTITYPASYKCESYKKKTHFGCIIHKSTQIFTFVLTYLSVITYHALSYHIYLVSRVSHMHAAFVIHNETHFNAWSLKKHACGYFIDAGDIILTRPMIHSLLLRNTCLLVCVIYYLLSISNWT